MSDEHNSHFYEPDAGHGLPHDPFKAIVAPRPIGWMSTQDKAGNRNLAPYSYFNAFSGEPPILGFSTHGLKDSAQNIIETGEFVWNLATRPLADAVNASSAAVASDVDEFALAGLTPVASRIVSAPRVLESPVNLECRLTQVIRMLDRHGNEIDHWLLLGEVVGVHIDRALLRNGVFDTAAALPIMRAGGRGDYFTITPDQLFQLRRPA